MTTTITITAFIAILLIVMIQVYNALIKQKQLTDEAFASIDVFLKQRYDLIPMLVSVTKGAKEYESTVLKEIVDLRSKGISGGLSVGELGNNEQRLSDRIHQLLVLVENYPDIKANANFQKLHDSLVKVEDDISKARRYYNATVRQYMTYQYQFPNVIIASLFRFPVVEYFAVSNDAERIAPNVKL